MKFAKDCLGFKKWSKILFSDESKFYMFGSNDIKYVRCPKGERFAPKYQLPTVKHCGSNIMDNEGIIDQNVYLNIIKNIMLPHGKVKKPCGWIFQQDKNLKHCANSIKNLFKKKVFFWIFCLLKEI